MQDKHTHVPIRKAVGKATSMRLARYQRLVLLLLVLSVAEPGCQSPTAYRQEANHVAQDIIRKKQKEALNTTEPFYIERPVDILRRRLLMDQKLP